MDDGQTCGSVWFFSLCWKKSLLVKVTLGCNNGKREDVLKLHLPQRSVSDQQDRGGFNLKAQTSEMSLRTQASVVFHFMVGLLVKCFCCDIDKISTTKDNDAKQSSNGTLSPCIKGHKTQIQIQIQIQIQTQTQTQTQIQMQMQMQMQMQAQNKMLSFK